MINKMVCVRMISWSRGGELENLQDVRDELDDLRVSLEVNIWFVCRVTTIDQDLGLPMRMPTRMLRLTPPES